MSFEDDKAAGNVANPAANSRSSEDSSFVPGLQTKNQSDFSPSSVLKNQEYLAFK
jgi:hypothetical protein